MACSYVRRLTTDGDAQSGLGILNRCVSTPAIDLSKSRQHHWPFYEAKPLTLQRLDTGQPFKKAFDFLKPEATIKYRLSEEKSGDPMDQDSNESSVFDDVWHEGVAKATSLELWGITYREEESIGRLLGYRTTGCVARLGDEELVLFRNLVESPGAARTDPISRVPFRPLFGLVFEGANTRTVLFVDSASHKWGYVREGTPRCADLTHNFPGVAELLELRDRLNLPTSPA